MSEKGKLTGWHVLFMFIAFFGVMIAVNVVFTVYAVKSFPGEQVEKSYVQGLNYNKALAEKKHQEELGWKAEIGFEKDADGKAVLACNWLDKNNERMVQLEVTARIIRPTSEEGMIETKLTGDGPGRYVASLETLNEGIWHVEMSATSPDGETAKAFKTLTW